IGLLVHEVAEGLGGLGEAPAGPLSLQLALDLGARFLEALHFSRLYARYPDDMEAEVRLDEIADLIRLEPERRVLERTHHHPAREKPEVPALGGGARIVGGLLRQFREAVGRLARFREDSRG